MMKNRFTLLILTLSLYSFAQEDLLKELDTIQVPQVVEATFKGLKIVNFESTKLIEKGAFTFSSPLQKAFFRPTNKGRLST